MNLFKKNHFQVLIIAIILIATVVFVSVLFSYQYNRYTEKSFLNYTTLSQFIAGFGTLLAVLIALFINEINNFLNRTEVELSTNPYDKNFNYYNIDVTYYLHLKITNLNNSVTARRCCVYLEPFTFNEKILDIPRPFPFARSGDLEKDIQFLDFVDFAQVKFSFGLNSETSLELILNSTNFQNISFDLKNGDCPPFKIQIYSSSFKNIIIYEIKVKIKKEEIIEFLENCKQIREDYTKSDKSTDLIYTIKDSYEFNKFYDDNLLTLEIKKIEY